MLVFGELLRHSGGMTDAVNEEWTVERHLAGQPEFAIYLYRRFIQLMDDIGPFTYAFNKTTITSKGTRRGFAGAHAYRSGLRGYFDMQREVRDPRIRSVAPYTNKLFAHNFRVSTAGQLDEVFAGWLGEAYKVGNGAPLR